jgi:hypothetical protein
VIRPQGTPRSEPWLSLEDDEQQVRRLIARLAHETWESVCVGNPAPIVADRADRMRHPQPGDLVVEHSALYLASYSTDPAIEHVYKGVGYLVAVQEEPFYSEEAIAHAPDDYTEEDRAMTEKVWYVQYGPDPEDVCRWVNCDFVAIDLGSMDTP